MAGRTKGRHQQRQRASRLGHVAASKKRLEPRGMGFSRESGHKALHGSTGTVAQWLEEAIDAAGRPSASDYNRAMQRYQKEVRNPTAHVAQRLEKAINAAGNPSARHYQKALQNFQKALHAAVSGEK